MYITKNEYERLKSIEKNALTFDGLGFIIKSCKYEPEKVGKLLMEQYFRIKNAKR